jgi:hypothetical protein
MRRFMLVIAVAAGWGFRTTSHAAPHGGHGGGGHGGGHGMSHGSAHGMSHGMAHGLSYGSAHGMTHGGMHGGAHGMHSTGGHSGLGGAHTPMTSRGQNMPTLGGQRATQMPSRFQNLGSVPTLSSRQGQNGSRLGSPRNLGTMAGPSSRQGQVAGAGGPGSGPGVSNPEMGRLGAGNVVGGAGRPGMGRFPNGMAGGFGPGFFGPRPFGPMLPVGLPALAMFGDPAFDDDGGFGDGMVTVGAAADAQPLAVVPAGGSDIPPEECGLKIMQVAPNAAARADLRVRDIVVMVAGTRTQSFAELTAALAAAGTIEIVIINGENNQLEKMLITPLNGKIGVAADPVQLQ